MAKQTAKQKSKERKELLILRTLVTLLILLLLFLWAAAHFGWWPYSKDHNLGSAFSSTEQSKSTAGKIGATGASGSTGAAGSSGANGGNGGSTTPPPPSSSSSILKFAAEVNSGDSKQEVSGEARGLNEHCAILVSSSTGGKQEVCTYTEGDKVVTVTYMDDHVISASRSGF